MKNINSTRINLFKFAALLSKLDVASTSSTEGESTQSTHDIDQGFISYPSTTKSEEQVTLKQFLQITVPYFLIGLLVFAPLPVLASQQLKRKIEKKITSTTIEELDTVAKSSGFKVFYPTKIRAEIALKARLLANKGKTCIGRKLVEIPTPLKRSPLFKTKFVKPEVFFEVTPGILLKEIKKTPLQKTVVELPLTVLIPASVGLLQALNVRLENLQLIEKIRGGVFPSLPAAIGWIGNVLNAKNKAGQIYDTLRGKKTKPSNSDTNSNSSNWSDFFPSENSNTSNTPTPDLTIVSFIKQVGASSGSVLVIWYFLAVYNKSRRRGKKLPVPEFILPDLVPEVRHVPFKEKLYNFAMTLVDLSTPTPYAIILLALFIYFFKYAGKENNPIDNAFSFVNTLFQQLVKATETTQNYLAEELRRTNEEAKNAQKELKEEHRLQREKLTEELNVCQKDMGESLIFNQYSGQVNQQLRSHLDTCERLLSKEEEKSLITSRKISQFKAIIKNEDGSFNEQKFDTLASEVQDVIQNDLMSSQTLQKVSQRWEDRMLNIDRSLPAFPVKKVVEYHSPVDKFIDGIFNIFGIQTRPSETSHSSQKNSRESRARYENGGDPISEGK